MAAGDVSKNALLFERNKLRLCFGSRNILWNSGLPCLHAAYGCYTLPYRAVNLKIITKFFFLFSKFIFHNYLSIQLLQEYTNPHVAKSSRDILSNFFDVHLKLYKLKETSKKELLPVLGKKTPRSL